MKRQLLSILGIAAGLSVSAQLADGSTAPDFTSTDLDGNTHSLYADYLDQGKVVILDISATWCGPCWSYHNSHAMKDVSDAFGIGGANMIFPLFDEGDASTTVADLNGTGGNTTGDWVTGTPYPIFDDADIANAYQIAYYPTVYGICPDRTLYEIGGQTSQYQDKSASGLVLFAKNQCGISLPSDNAAMQDAEGKICEGAMTSKATIVNHGDADLTSATLTLSFGGNVVETINWTGTLSTMGTEEVAFSEISSPSAGTYTVEVTMPNGNTDMYTGADVVTFETESVSSTPSNFVKVEVKTDNYGSETTWSLTDASGNVVASGGPYTDGTSAVVYSEFHELTPGCYNFVINDAYGDGVDAGYGVGYYKIFDENGTVFVSGASFTTQEKKTFALEAGQLNLSVADDAVAFNMYPNPVQDELIINGNVNGLVNVAVYNQIGALVMEATNVSVEGGYKLDMSELVAGNYFVNITGENVNISERVNVVK